ncbi:MAG: hypothetical protein IAE89_05905 [Anaerolineae bacterium]|nr:hypothetical protein [Anaerolineae bacterium]
MSRKTVLILAGISILALIVIIMTALLTPTQTNPAAEVALTFTQAVSQGDDSAAMPLLSDQAAAYVAENCPDGSVSACVARLIPEDWGNYISTVFRRAMPDGDHWNVDLISTYEHDLGGSGVCIYVRAEQDEAGNFKVAQFAGFVNCGDPSTRNMATNPDAPNRVPPTLE